LGEDHWAATANLTLAAVAAGRGDAARARTLARNAVAAQRASGTPIVLAVALLEAAGVYADLADPAAAAGLLSEALELARSGEFRLAEAEAVEGAAWASATTGDAASAARMLGAAEAMREATEIGMPPSRHRRLQAAETAARAALGADTFATTFAAG
jgi:hypothetical protein